MRTRRQIFLGIPVALSVGLVLSACGAGSTVLESGATNSTPSSTEAPSELPTTAPTTAEPATTTTTAPASETAAPEVNNFPDATVIDVSSGEPFNLGSLADSGTPVAMWFYYPH
jgi:hypothetical protein